MSITQKIGDYEVGINGVTTIEKTEHGNEKTTIYKITYENGDILFYGKLEGEPNDH